MRSALMILVAGGLGLAGCHHADRQHVAKSDAGTSETAKADAVSAAAEMPAVAQELPASLAGTDWRLVALKSMDPAIGEVRPADPSLYTLRLDADGTARLRLNCNRANGRWTSTPEADPSGGSFEFGPLAATRALCPPPSLDERMVAEAGHVRAYLFERGQLHMALDENLGIWVWEPYEPAPSEALTPESSGGS